MKFMTGYRITNYHQRAKRKSVRLPLSLVLICFYFILLSFNGIIVKFIANNSSLMQLKRILPEIVLTISALCMICNRRKNFTFWSTLLLLYTLFIFCIGIIKNGLDDVQILYLFRDLIFPYFIFSLLGTQSFLAQEKDKFFKILGIIGKIYLISGCFLGAVEKAMGLEWTARFYTGYTFYGEDPSTKIRVWTSGSGLRVPGLTGMSVSFAVYALYYWAILLFTHQNTKGRRLAYNIIWSLLAFLIILFADQKTSLVMFVLILVLSFLYSFEKRDWKNNASIYGVALFLAVFLFAFVYVHKTNFTFSSIQERLTYWSSFLTTTDWLQIIIPYKATLYGAGGTGFTSVFDNFYLYLLFSQGLFGLLLFLSCLKNQKEVNKKATYYFLNLALLIIILLASLTTNVSQGRSTLAFFSILYPLSNHGTLKKLAISGKKSKSSVSANSQQRLSRFNTSN